MSSPLKVMKGPGQPSAAPWATPAVFTLARLTDCGLGNLEAALVALVTLLSHVSVSEGLLDCGHQSAPNNEYSKWTVRVSGGWGNSFVPSGDGEPLCRLQPLCRSGHRG